MGNKEKALRYLLDKTNAPEYTDEYNDCNEAWNALAHIMESFAKEAAEKAWIQAAKKVYDPLTEKGFTSWWYDNETL